MISQNNNLIDDGFTFVDNVFTQKDILNSKNAFWDVINCKYDTGVNPENRFWNLGEDPKKIIESKGLQQKSDPKELEGIIDKILSKNKDKVEQYKSGKDKLFGFFVGQVMKESAGKANPQLVNEILKKKLK